MNNEFEKNTEKLDINDNTSEFINDRQNNEENTVPEEASVEATSEEQTAEPVLSEENACAGPEELSCVNADESAVTETPFANEADGENEAAAAKEETACAPEAEKHSDEKSYLPGSEAYLYSKPGNGENGTVGCVWENSSAADANKKDKKSLSGFKVFTAAMLAVFTLSSLTIAGFLALDYVRDKDASYAAESEPENVSGSKNNPVTEPFVYDRQTTLISTFAEDENALTKSQVAAKCSPSAVGIVIEQEQNYSGYSIPFGFGYDFNIPGGTQIVQGSGSGFIFSADGYIITNHHVVDGASNITVHFHDGSTAAAELVGSDSFTDIAVIKIDPTDKTLIPMEIGDSTLMKVGDEVIAIGCPAGIEFMGTVTDGIISAINRDVELDNDGSSKTKTMTLLQTNATINRGNSGGPLINTRGQVIGINTLKLSSDYEGIGFSIPMSGALPIINQLIEYGEVVERTESFVSSEGVIGISASEITKGDSEYFDIPMGILVVQIDKDSSASKAGLRRGDIITKFNGQAVTTVNQLNQLKASFKAGDEVTLTVYRDSDDTSDTFDITFKLDMAE